MSISSNLGQQNDYLKKKIESYFKSQGFVVNEGLELVTNRKEYLKGIHYSEKKDQLKSHKKRLLKLTEKIKPYTIHGGELNVDKIKIRLIQVTNSEDLYGDIFLWWNLTWWSVPYTKPIGRLIKIIVWDDYHNVPIGLIELQSPPLRSKVRDDYLKINSHSDAFWINQSLYGHRIGALPPYNELLGAKLVALLLTTNEIRQMYYEKYNNRETLMKKRILPANLLFITTTSAYGNSSVYDRLKYKDENVAQFLGYTTGRGTFHISDDIYKELLIYLHNQSIDTTLGYGTGPSRKLFLIEKAFSLLGLNNYHYHNIKRGYYLFPHVKNLLDVIHNEHEPDWIDRSTNSICEYWKNRYCIPRSVRKKDWKLFDNLLYLKNKNAELMSL